MTKIYNYNLFNLDGDKYNKISVVWRSNGMERAELELDMEGARGLCGLEKDGQLAE